MFTKDWKDYEEDWMRWTLFNWQIKLFIEGFSIFEWSSFVQRIFLLLLVVSKLLKVSHWHNFCFPSVEQNYVRRWYSTVVWFSQPVSSRKKIKFYLSSWHAKFKCYKNQAVCKQKLKYFNNCTFLTHWMNGDIKQYHHFKLFDYSHTLSMLIFANRFLSRAEN